MPTIMKECRVCGKKYEACRSVFQNSSTTFRWQDVACSPECGAEYLRRVNEARGLIPAAVDTETASETHTKKTRKRSQKVKDEVAAEN